MASWKKPSPYLRLVEAVRRGWTEGGGEERREGEGVKIQLCLAPAEEEERERRKRREPRL